MKEHKLYLKDTEEESQIKIDDLDITNMVTKYEVSRSGLDEEVRINLEMTVKDKDILINKKANLEDLLK